MRLLRLVPSYPQMFQNLSKMGGDRPHGRWMRTPRPWSLPLRPSPLGEVLRPGVTREMVRTQVAAGRLLRLREGVYLAASAWPQDAAAQHVVRARAEQAACPSAVISHHSAALSWGLPSPPLADWVGLPPSLTVPPSGGHRSGRSARACLRVAALPGHHVVVDAEGWAVTTVARTAADLAAALPLPDALAVVDAAARLLCASMVPAVRRTDYANRSLGDAARDLLREAASGRRGLAAARSAIELADPRRESPIESLTAAALHLAGLPMPQFQAPIRTPFGTLYPDCLWEEQRLIGEADGAIKYTDRDAIVREKEREQVLRDLGFGVVRWLGKEITLRPDLVVARIARALASAS